MVCSWVLTKFGKESLISCNPVAMQDAAIGKTASHHFGISSKVKDINAKQMLENNTTQSFLNQDLGWGLKHPATWKLSHLKIRKF